MQAVRCAHHDVYQNLEAEKIHFVAKLNRADFDGHQEGAASNVIFLSLEFDL